MNIFFLDTDPKLCARAHSDIHLRKMILETAQLLCAAHHLHPNKPPRKSLPLYKLTHQNHPSAKWARASKMNYSWLAMLGIQLCKEYTHRFGKDHATHKLLKWLYLHIPYLDGTFMTDIPLVMPEHYHSIKKITLKGPLEADKLKSAVRSYRKYYKAEKATFGRLGKPATYTNRTPPKWWPELLVTNPVQ